MRGLFYLKRLAHKSVNILFYGGFFVAGYIFAKGLEFKFELIKELFPW